MFSVIVDILNILSEVVFLFCFFNQTVISMIGFVDSFVHRCAHGLKSIGCLLMLSSNQTRSSGFISF